MVFTAAGVLHFVIPAMYERIVPPWLPAPRLLVLVSGACEVAGGIGLLVSPARRAAAIGLLALLLAVWPANVQMLLDAHASHASHASAAWQAALVARLPLQVVLMAWIWWAAKAPRHDPDPR